MRRILERRLTLWNQRTRRRNTMKTFEVQIAAWIQFVEAETETEASDKVEKWLKDTVEIEHDKFRIELDDCSSFLALEVDKRRRAL